MNATITGLIINILLIKEVWYNLIVIHGNISTIIHYPLSYIDLTFNTCVHLLIFTCHINKMDINKIEGNYLT